MMYGVRGGGYDSVVEYSTIQQHKFGLLNGARIVRIATYPDYAHVSSFHLWNLSGVDRLLWFQMGRGSRTL